MKKTITVTFTMIALTLVATAKERDWQEGKLIDITSEPYVIGRVVNGVGGVSQREKIKYQIDDGKFVYTASHVHRRRDTALPLTVNAKVKFAIEKSRFYLLDENGEEHELKLEKKALKEG
jgi:hypothetical protein